MWKEAPAWKIPPPLVTPTLRTCAAPPSQLQDNTNSTVCAIQDNTNSTVCAIQDNTNVCLTSRGTPQCAGSVPDTA
eukprot:2183788-Rhodomonas_salina.3